jgi:hypothetical protein
MNSLNFQPRKPIRHRSQPAQQAVAAPVALALVAAYYDGDAPGVHLIFDRAIDVSGLVLSAFTVLDGPDFIHFAGTGTPFMVGPSEVLVFLHNAGSASGSEVLLTAGAANGIAAVDDGGTWEGATALELPFG